MASLGVSQVGAATASQVVKGFFGKCIELAGCRIPLELLVPQLRIVLGEPGAKSGQILIRKLAYRLLNF